MPDVGTGVVPILPDFSRFGKELERGVGPHIAAAGKDMEQTFAASAKKSAASVDAAFAKTKSGIDIPVTANTRAFIAEMDREVDRAANKATADLKDLPVSADADKLDRSVVDAARKAAKKAADELSRIPGGVDEARFRSEVAAAAQKAANEATTRLANIPAGINAASLQSEVAAAAAKAARPIEIDVNADTSDFRKLPSDIRPHVAKAGAEMESTFAASAKSAGKAMAGAIGTVLVIDVGRRLLDLGTQVEVFGKKAEVVFEDSADEVKDWAKVNAAALGLTRSHLVGVTAGFADLLKPMGFTAKQAAEMSTDVVGLAGALAAWSEAQDTAADVAQTLAKAMLGEREELKGLGISISEADVKSRLLAKGQGELTGAALQQAEAIATQELIFEKSTDAQTAWANGSQDAIKSQNELRAKVGELTEQMATGLLPVFQAAATILEAIPDPAIKAAAGLVAIGATVIGIRKVVDAVSGLSNPLERSSLATGGLQAGLGRIGAVGASLGIAAAGMDLFTNQLLRIQHGAGPALSELGNALVRFGNDGKVTGELSRQFGDDLSKLGDKLKDLEGGTGSGGIIGNIFSPNSRSRLKDAKRDIDALDKSLADLVRSGEQDAAENILTRLAKDAGVSVSEVTKRLDDYRSALADVDTDQILAGKSAKGLAGATKDLGLSAEDAAEAIEKQKQELEDLTRNINDAYGASQNLIGSQLGVADAVDALRDSAAATAGKERELAEAIRIHGAASNEAKAAGEALQDSRRRQVGDIDALAQANVRLADQQATAAGRTLSDADKYRIYRDELIRVKDTIAPGSELRKNLEGLINSLPPPEVKAKVVIDITEAAAAVARLQAQFASGWGKATPLGRSIPAHHEGGMVGGQGFEVPIMAQPGEYVVRSSAVKALGTDTMDRLNRFHEGGLIGGRGVLDRMMRVGEPVAATASTTGTRVDMGGVVLNGVRDGEDALTRLPMRLRSAIYLAGAS